MEPGTFAYTVKAEWWAVSHAPLSFCFAVLIIGILIWGAMKWRYDGEIDRLTSKVAKLEDGHAITGVSKLSARPVRLSQHIIEPDQPVIPPTHSADVKVPDDRKDYLPAGVTLAFMTEQIKDKTEIQMASAIKPYIGKWILLRGRSVTLKRASTESK